MADRAGFDRYGLGRPGDVDSTCQPRHLNDPDHCRSRISPAKLEGAGPCSTYSRPRRGVESTVLQRVGNG